MTLPLEYVMSELEVRGEFIKWVLSRDATNTLTHYQLIYLTSLQPPKETSKNHIKTTSKSQHKARHITITTPQQTIIENSLL